MDEQCVFVYWIAVSKSRIRFFMKSATENIRKEEEAYRKHLWWDRYTGEEDTAGICDLLTRKASALYRNEASFRVECEDTFTALLPSWHKANTFAAVAHSMETVTRMTLLPSVFFESFPVLEWSFLSALFFPSFKSPANKKYDKLSVCSWGGRNVSNLSGWDSTEAWEGTYPGIGIICGHVIGSENRITVRNEN